MTQQIDTTPIETPPGSAAPQAQRGRSVRGRGRLLASVIGLPILGVVATVGAWWAAVIAFDIRPIFLPAPPDIVRAYGVRPDHMMEQTWATLVATLYGFALAVLAGLVMAVAVAASRTVNRALMPQIVAINAIPKVAIAPLLIVWLGFGQSTRVVLAFLISFFPIVVAAIAGLNSVPSDLGELSRSLSASRWQTFVKIRFPWALPQIFVGLKLGITLAVIGTVVAEMQVPNAGLGAVIKIAAATSDTPRAFAAIVLLMVLSVALFYAVVAAERLVVPWARATSAYAE
jgi:NitT/TauT family transport system permease protein